MRFFRALFVGLTLTLTAGLAMAQIPISEVEEKLAGEGLEVWVHGSVPSHGLYVVSYRRPDNFFVFIDLSIYAQSKQAKAALEGSKRHDKIKVWGELKNDRTSQPHIGASKITLMERFTGLDPYPPYEREITIPTELEGKNSFIGKVHALFNGGEILVVEYKDAVLPVYVKSKFRNLTANLYRGDKVQVNFVLQDTPRRPTHLNLDDSVETPIQILKSAHQEHGQLQTREGQLVMFPKSPQVQFNVFALRQDIGDGVMLEYTLVNFEDPKLFKQIREKLQAAWDKQTDGIKNGRNKLINTKIRVRATGKINVVDPNQANPQVLLESLNDIEVLN